MRDNTSFPAPPKAAPSVTLLVLPHLPSRLLNVQGPRAQFPGPFSVFMRDDLIWSHLYADNSHKCMGILASQIFPLSPRCAHISTYLLDCSTGCLIKISGFTYKSNDLDICWAEDAGSLRPQGQREDRTEQLRGTGPVILSRYNHAPHRDQCGWCGFQKLSSLHSQFRMIIRRNLRYQIPRDVEPWEEAFGSNMKKSPKCWWAASVTN